MDYITPYWKARSLIQTGDILGIQLNGIFPKLINGLQSWAGFNNVALISHVGVAWWLEGRLYVIGMDGVTNALIPLSHYDRCKIHVYPNPTNLETFTSYFGIATQNYIRYDWIDILRIGIRLLLRKKGTPSNRIDETLVCSTFVLWWLKLAGFESTVPSLCCPAEICATLAPERFRIN